ncbi:hypothetical protein AIOL_000761 [Candidatus Rhodobacter oscarellae]|uniref:Zn-ribbon-containing n=1 Tax=Candidatus Rhodobacter oscarellae TaxID=1675527 RepID=A0A0J9ECT3_9RHOB|nr:DciA family protein [Candidatus Rhodobacter lobularis]KMW60597.1 hypothetical protein AIOL_000761 [Candidatus Rhodobacter lobularis]
MSNRNLQAGRFKRAIGLVQRDIRKASESRGFAVSKLLTNWAEIAGEQVAAIARPVNVSYAKGGFGATLTLLTTGAQAPMLQMQTERLKERVNACYGYAAIRHIRITQTAPTGFAEGRADFEHAAQAPQKPVPSKAQQEAARETAAPVADDQLREALARLGANVLSRSKSS